MRPPNEYSYRIPRMILGSGILPLFSQGKAKINPREIFQGENFPRAKDAEADLSGGLGGVPNLHVLSHIWYRSLATEGQAGTQKKAPDRLSVIRSY